MKKLFKGLYNVIAFGSVAYTLAVGTYMSLPVEYQFLNNFGWSEALITGGSSGVLGLVLVYVKSAIAKQGIDVDKKVNEFATSIVSVATQFKDLKNDYKALKDSSSQEIKLLQKEVSTLADLLKADMQLKLSNPMLKEEAKALAQKLLEGGSDEA